jgi:hypothetical protein
VGWQLPVHSTQGSRAVMCKTKLIERLVIVHYVHPMYWWYLRWQKSQVTQTLLPQIWSIFRTVRAHGSRVCLLFDILVSLIQLLYSNKNNKYKKN